MDLAYELMYLWVTSRLLPFGEPWALKIIALRWKWNRPMTANKGIELTPNPAATATQPAR